MRVSLLVLAFSLTVAGPVAAQTPPPALVKTFTSSAEVQQLIAKAKTDRKGDAPITVEPILSLANLPRQSGISPDRRARRAARYRE